jgi:hypothetical protein
MPVDNPHTPPTHVSTWAADGGADKALPASPTTGHAVGDKTDFNSDLNYVVKNLVDWADFNISVNAARVAFNNVDYNNTENFGVSSLSASHMTYDALADRWYHSARRSSNLEPWDSPTGLDGTWTLGTVLSAATAEDMTPLRSNGTYVGVGIDDEFFLSTDLTVSNLPGTATSTFNAITQVRDLIYDQDSGRWFAVGASSSGTQSVCESSADGSTWVQELVLGGSILMRSISHDNAGGGVITTDTPTVNYYITGGMEGAWSGATTDPATAIYQTVYAPSLGLYIGTDTANSIFFSEDGNNWHDTDLNAGEVFVTDDFVLMGLTSPNRTAYAFTRAALSRTSYTFQDLGFWAVDGNNAWDANTTVECGSSGKLIFCHGVSDVLATSVYGPTE